MEVGCWNNIKERENSLSTVAEENMKIVYTEIILVGPEREQGELDYRKKLEQIWGLLNCKLSFDFPLWTRRAD